MASLAIPQRAVQEREWVTPEEQLNRLYLPIAKEVSRSFRLPLDVAKIIAQFASEAPVTNWYTALPRLKVVLKKIPALPKDIHQILGSPCPIYGAPRRVKDTHFLALIPKEFGSLKEFERTILKPHTEAEYSRNQNPLSSRYLNEMYWHKYGDVPFESTHWVLMTKDVLPGSRSLSWNDQVTLVDVLSREALANYKIPTLQQVFAAIIIYEAATGERLYQVGNEKNRHANTYIRVQNTDQGFPLMVAGSSLSGVRVDAHFDRAGESIGVAAFREF